MTRPLVAMGGPFTAGWPLGRGLGPKAVHAVLLIGIDGYHPLTIVEGNHRMAAALLTMPESAHRRFRFYCGLSPNMNLCCWHHTDLRSLSRYARHTFRYMFRDFLVAKAQRWRF